jgi:hypothetical protein
MTIDKLLTIIAAVTAALIVPASAERLPIVGDLLLYRTALFIRQTSS